MKKANIIFILFLIIHISSDCQQNYYSYSQDNFRKSPEFNAQVSLTNPDTKILDAAIYYVTNEQRLKNGLPILKYHELLEATALLHSGNMVKQHFFNHINPKSRKYKAPEDRARSVGIKNPFIAENIIESFVLDYKDGSKVFTDGHGKFWYKSEDEPLKVRTYLSMADKMVDDWMNSPGHRKNILSKDALQLGCGTAFFESKNSMPSVMGTQNFQLFEPVK